MIRTDTGRANSTDTRKLKGRTCNGEGRKRHLIEADSAIEEAMFRPNTRSTFSMLVLNEVSYQRKSIYKYSALENCQMFCHFWSLERENRTIFESEPLEHPSSLL